MKTEETLFRTVVEVPKWANPMRKDHRFALLGSCFAQNIGERFQSYGLEAECNPLGVTYNPESIAIQVKQALTPDGELPLFRFNDQEWHCWLANTLISDTDEDRLRETIRRKFSELGEVLRKADFVFITLGTNKCYRLKENGLTVTNCHKQPDVLFEEVTLDLEVCTKTLSNLMENLSKECPKAQVVFTVSPFRYKKYGFHGNQLAKATLLLAVDNICQRFPEKTSYFPAYEILLDELRDYRFYTEDMIHPSPVAVDFIWQRMVECCMDNEMQQYLKDYEPFRRAKMHRPLNS